MPDLRDRLSAVGSVSDGVLPGFDGFDRSYEHYDVQRQIVSYPEQKQQLDDDEERQAFF